MPRINTDIARYLPVMKASRRKLKTACVVQGTEIAAMMGLTWRILKARIVRDRSFPVIERGANGKPWTFEAVSVLDYMIADTERLQAERKAREKRTARLAGIGGDPIEVPEVYDHSGSSVDSAVDLAAHSRALNALAQAQMTTHRLKQMQGEYVLAADHDRVVATIMSTMQTETLAISTKMDPAGAWEPSLRKSVEDMLKNVLLTVKAACERELRAIRAAGTQ